jgi:hypothetical protein
MHATYSRQAANSVTCTAGFHLTFVVAGSYKFSTTLLESRKLLDEGIAITTRHHVADGLTSALFPVQELLQNDFDMLNFFKTDPSCRVQVQGPAGPQMYEPR